MTRLFSAGFEAGMVVAGFERSPLLARTSRKYATSIGRNPFTETV
jgi:hypothetical protein